MAPDRAILSAAESVADGRPVDWDLVESQAPPEQRDVVRQLRIVADLSQLHRSMPDAPAAPHRQPPVSVPALGTWGHLSVLERLGGGAFADVFRAWDRELEREVALKLLRAEPDHTDPIASRIADEGRLLARVHHPNVVTVHGVATHNGRVGLWMELVHGETLEARLRTHGPLAAHEAAVIGIELCRALAAIHAAGLVHRDVKAQNVIREQGGRVVLMDLGTGRDAASPVAEGSRVAGTPLYLAPELLRDAPATPQTDVYSLGVLLYRMVSGDFPVRAATIEELHARHTEEGVKPLGDARPDLPSAFVQVIHRAIDPDPSRRYGSAGALASDLARAIGDDPVRSTAGLTLATGRARRWSRRLLATAVVVGAVALAALLWPSHRPAVSAVPAGAVHSVAVLPLLNLTGDREQDYFADGMTDELIGTLGRLNGLNVISRTSIMQYKGLHKSIPDIARALGVDAVLEGSVFVQPGGGAADLGNSRVRVNARLIYAGTDTQIWDQTFEAARADVLTIQRRIATAVAEGISLALTEQQKNALAGDATNSGAQDPAAFDLYLRGRYYANMRTEEGLRRSILYFQEALSLDPRSARAQAGLADAYSLLHVYGIMPRADAEAAALAAAMKALALDDTLAEAHAAIGYIRLRRFDWKGGEAELRRAISLKPSYAQARRWFASWLAKQGRLPEALAEMKTALEQDPLMASANAFYGGLLMMSRKYDEATAQIQKALQMDPQFARGRMTLAEVYAFKRDYRRALAEAERAVARPAAPPKKPDLELLADLGYIRAVAGRRADAMTIRDDLIRRANANEDSAAGGVAIIYVGLGDADRAFEWLGRARDLHDPVVEYMKVDQRFDGLRSDPRFSRLLASVGLAQ